MTLVTDLYPDKIVDYIVQELAYEGSKGVTFDRLWEIVSAKITVDALYKKIIYAWLAKNDKIEVLSEDGQYSVPSPTSYNEIEQGRYFLKVTSDFQWISLTGAPKENNPVGGMPFDLLLEIAKSRHEGIDSSQLIEATGQDARSLTSRIKALGSLVQKIPIIRNGRTLSLLIMTKFYDAKRVDPIAVSKDEKDLMVNTDDVRGRIINALKAAKHSVRQVGDLRREMEMDKSPSIKRVFRSCVNYLEDKGYLNKVLVVSPAAPKRKFSSLKYIKDYVPKAERAQDIQEDIEEDDDHFDLNEDLIDDELKDLEVEEPPTSLANVENLEIRSSEEDAKETPLFNRFFPFQNQIYEIVEETGAIGLSSTEILGSIFGRSYTRLFSRLIESYTSGKLIPHMANHGIIRNYDFKGRVKFYRYLTRPNMLKFANQPLDDKGSELPPYKALKTTVEALNKKNFIPMNAGVDLIENNSSTSIYWFGHSDEMDSGQKAAHKESRAVKRESRVHTVIDNDTVDTPKRKRGRPKKSEEKQAIPQPKKAKNKKDKADDDMGNVFMANGEEDKNGKIQETQQQTENVSIAASTTPPGKKATEPPKVVTVSDLQGPSFQAIERLKVILKILDGNDGVYRNEFPLLDAVRKELHMNVDKRTLRRDLQTLVAQGKIRLHEFFIGRQNPKMHSIVVSSTASQDSIQYLEDIIRGKKQQKAGITVKKLDEIQNVELDFFDNDLEKSFMEPPEAPPSKKQRTRKSSSTSEIVEELQRESTTKAKKPTKKEAKKETKKEPKKKIAAESKTKKKAPSKVKQEVQSDDWDSNAKRARRPHAARKKRNASHLNSAETMLLFKAVIICKTINENQINWEKIANLFDDVSEDVLRKKWPRIRLMMGPEGSKSARRTWKRILLASVREGKITLPEVEELELETLVKLWQDAEVIGGVEETGESLFANYEENFAQYNFVKNNVVSNAFAYDSNSMIQREQYLINKSFTYSDDAVEKFIEETTNEKSNIKSTIKRTIIAILASGTNANIKKLPLLDSFDKTQIDDVFLDMTKKKEVAVGADSKVVFGETLTHILDDTSYDLSLRKVNNFHSVLKHLFEADKGLALDPIFDNSFMVPIVELLNQNGLDLIRVDHYRREVLSGYEARTLEREKLDCDIIVSKGTKPIKDAAEASPLVPMGKPCSRIWINVEGQINKTVWNKVNRVVLTSILSQPGITKLDLYRKLSPLLSKFELDEVLTWLIEAKSLTEKEFEGLWLLPGWYTVFCA